MKRSGWLWLLAVVLTLSAAVWQRWSGPTYPVRVQTQVGQWQLSGKLLRTHDTSRDLPVSLTARMGGDIGATRGAGSPTEDSLAGAVLWRRFPTADPWMTVPLQMLQTPAPAPSAPEVELGARLPRQPPAGKVEYSLLLHAAGDTIRVPPGEALVARFKGAVPLPVLILHIIFIFCGMLLSTRAGLEALADGPQLPRQALLALVLLGVGGLTLGPIVQKYAFGAFWTGWPLGEDLTDNKLAVAVLAWLIAVLDLRRRVSNPRRGRLLALAAAVVVSLIFAIPHSMHGSTLDYETMQHIQR